MAQVLRTSQANLDLLEIWTYIAESDIASADRVLEAINRKCQSVAGMPGMGRSREELATSLRSVTEGNYVIKSSQETADFRQQRNGFLSAEGSCLLLLSGIMSVSEFSALPFVKAWLRN